MARDETMARDEGSTAWDREDGTTGNDVVMDDVRIDEVHGIDRSEQSGLGGDSSVLEAYGTDVERDDLPEPEDVPFEPILPGSDRDADQVDEEQSIASAPHTTPMADGRHDDLRRQLGTRARQDYPEGVP